jgi:hypothetical protein
MTMNDSHFLLKISFISILGLPMTNFGLTYMVNTFECCVQNEQQQVLNIYTSGGGYYWSYHTRCANDSVITSARGDEQSSQKSRLTSRLMTQVIFKSRLYASSRLMRTVQGQSL